MSKCPVCGSLVNSDPKHTCDLCGVVTHPDCQTYAGRCSTYGCQPQAAGQVAADSGIETNLSQDGAKWVLFGLPIGTITAVVIIAGWAIGLASILIFITWFYWIHACVLEIAADQIERSVPPPRRRGFSIFPVFPVFPMGLSAAAAWFDSSVGSIGVLFLCAAHLVLLFRFRRSVANCHQRIALASKSR